MYPTGRTDGSVRQNMEVGVVLLIISPNGPSGEYVLPVPAILDSTG